MLTYPKLLFSLCQHNRIDWTAHTARNISEFIEQYNDLFNQYNEITFGKRLHLVYEKSISIIFDTVEDLAVPYINAIAAIGSKCGFTTRLIAYLPILLKFAEDPASPIMKITEIVVVIRDENYDDSNALILLKKLISLGVSITIAIRPSYLLGRSILTDRLISSANIKIVNKNLLNEQDPHALQVSENGACFHMSQYIGQFNDDSFLVKTQKLRYEPTKQRGRTS